MPGSFNPLSAAGRRKLVTLHHPKTIATFVSHASEMAGEVTRLDLVSIYAPFSKESVQLFEQIEKVLLAKTETAGSDWYGAEVDFVGTTAGIRDLEAVTASDRLRIKLLVVLLHQIHFMVDIQRHNHHKHHNSNNRILLCFLFNIVILVVAGFNLN